MLLLNNCFCGAGDLLFSWAYEKQIPSTATSINWFSIGFRGGRKNDSVAESFASDAVMAVRTFVLSGMYKIGNQNVTSNICLHSFLFLPGANAAVAGATCKSAWKTSL
jgi:hypothetical protein